MKVAGLFAGIGGIEAGLRQAGHQDILLCENEPGAIAVLRTRFAGTELVEDVRALDSLPKRVDLITAGFPCQDLSQAGKTAGISGLRSSLVNEVFRLLRKRRVPWILLENVPFMLELGRGSAMDAIVCALEELGYVWAYRVVNSASFGVPQRRERVYLLASAVGDPWDVLLADETPSSNADTALGRLAHGFYWTEGIRGLGWAVDSIPTLKNGSTIGIPSPPAILLPNGTVIKPDIRDAERMQGFSSDWTLAAEGAVRRSRRWALVGNAVTLPVASWIGQRLNTPGQYDVSRDLPLPEGSRWPKAARFDGQHRRAVAINSAPVSVPRPPLHQFLQHPGEPLSARATEGFLERTTRSQLRFPPGFLDLLRGHLERMQSRSFAAAA